ncbi:MAG TPA: response regulator [Anaerolineaceae bacterium]
MTKKRVLIVDDALDLGRLLQSALATLDPEMPVAVVPSAEEAMLEAGRRPLDLLVVDIRLPGMSGIDLVPKLRARNPGIKVIIMTGLTDDRTLQTAHELQPDVFMQKPLEVYDFLERVQQVLGLPPTPSTPVAAPGRSETPEEMPARGRLADVLAGIRGSLGAIAAALLDENGHVVTLAGDLPADFENTLVPPLAGALAAAERVALLIGQAEPGVVQVIKGDRYHLVCAPVHRYALVLLLKPGRSSLRLSLAVDETMTAQADLLQILREMGLLDLKPAPPQPVEILAEITSRQSGVPPRKTEPLKGVLPPADTRGIEAVELPERTGQPEMPSKPLEGDQTALAGLAALFEKKAPAAGVDVDDFWEKASTSASSAPVNPDALTFEQARKLGLTPQDSGG